MTRLLVIDDEAIIRESFQQVFEKLSDRYHLTLAASGEAGLERLRAESFDLVFTDLKMPGMDGLAVLEKGREIRPDTDFVMMTGYASVDSAVGAMKFGALDYIEKPFTAEELRAFVERMEHLREERRTQKEKDEGFERFSWNLRAQHIVLILTFSLLSFTGIPLFWPEAFKGVFFFEDSSYLRGLLHRISAVGLIALSFFHIAHAAMSAEGNRNLRQLLPRLPGDLKEALGNILFTFGLRKEKPPAHKYSFFEKFEYFGVVWGTFIMVLTGLVMWFNEAFLRIFPLWVIDVAKVIHHYEAILAILTIAIWHMYNVHLKPGVFPMSRVWLTGRISREEMLHEHALEYEEVTGRSAAAQGGHHHPGA